MLLTLSKTMREITVSSGSTTGSITERKKNDATHHQRMRAALHQNKGNHVISSDSDIKSEDAITTGTKQEDVEKPNLKKSHKRIEISVTEGRAVII